MQTQPSGMNVLTAPPEDSRMAFVDEHLREAIHSRTKPHAIVALQAIHLLTTPEMEAIQRLPHDDGRMAPGSKNLLALAQYALFLEELRRDAFGNDIFAIDTQIITEKAVESLIGAIRNHLADARTLQDLQRVMGYQTTGRTDLSPGDRTAWSLTWRALFSIGQIPEEGERALDNFTYLLQTAQNWLLDGEPWSQGKDQELKELAAMLFVGIGEPSRQAVETNRAQKHWAEARYPALTKAFGADLGELLDGVTEGLLGEPGVPVVLEFIDHEA